MVAGKRFYWILGWLCVALAVFCWFMAVFAGKPVFFVIVGGVAQAAFLPFLAMGIAWLRYRRTDRGLVTRSVSDVFLWIAIVSTALIGAYQLYKVYDGLAS